MLQWEIKYFGISLFHIEIVKNDSSYKFQLYMCRVYKRHVENRSRYLPYTHQFRFRTDYPCAKQPQGTNICGFCVCDAMLQFTKNNTYEQRKIEVS